MDRREEGGRATAEEDGGGSSPVELVSPARRVSLYGFDICGNAVRLSRVGVEVAVGTDVRAKGNVKVDAELVVRLGRGVNEPGLALA